MRESKLQTANRLLRDGDLYVRFAPAKGAFVPDFLLEQPSAILMFGLSCPVPIPDLQVGTDGISGTLSFRQRGVPSFWVFLPWSCVTALCNVEGMGRQWALSGSVPAEPVPALPSKGILRAERPYLRLVRPATDPGPGTGEGPDPASDGSGGSDPGPPATA